ncbi:MAG: hypothetical protein A2Y33_14450 [Spirochaetes bacterium GWF1_51_8]|nr:MAG: hypothetical protein A2Y33_14450 [Spirochaetes bacterium GWF1_51_8]
MKLFAIFFMLPFALLSCALFNELLEPSDVNYAVVPSLKITSLSNNQIVGQGYTLSGEIKGLFAKAAKIRLIIDGKITQTSIPSGNMWSIASSVTSLGIHSNSVCVIGTDGKVFPETLLIVNQYNIPLYHIPLADNQIMVIYDFSGTYDPYEWGVVPFVYGDVSSFIAGAYNGINCTNGGITITGTGPQVLKYDAISGYYYNLFTIPDNTTYSFEFGLGNYSTSGWTELVNDFRNVYGKINSTLLFDRLYIKNKKIDGFNNFQSGYFNTPDQYINGTTIYSDYKRLYMNVGDHTGWSLHLSGGIIEAMQVRIVWTNVPSVIACTTPSTFWYPFAKLCSNSSTLMITPNMPPVITGDRIQIFTNGTWNSGTFNGLEITEMNVTNHTMEILLNLTPGTPRTIKYKFVNKYGWDWGEQSWDSFIALPTYNPGYIIGITNNFE